MVRFSCVERAGWLALKYSLSLCLLMIAKQAKGAAFVVPEEQCSPFGAYPNVLGVTQEDRASFHPVIKFPTIWTDSSSGERMQVPDIRVVDLTKPTELVFIVTEEDRAKRRKEVEAQSTGGKRGVPDGIPDFNVGRYDEDRRGLYTSELFEAAAARTLHVGIDLGGPIGTEVHSFADGIVHSVGYNPQLGDYGNVIVIEHTIPSSGLKVWALYGHLDGSTREGKEAGSKIKKGQVIGRVGDIYENGGWEGAHVHFQLCTEPPETHDMPGAVTLEDRQSALLLYPDPRYILGVLY